MKNNLASIIQNFEKKYLITFKPTKEFYLKVGIKQKKFGKVLRNEADLESSQIYALSQIFNIDYKEIVPQPEQVEIFEPEYVFLNSEKREKLENFKKSLGHKQADEFVKIFN